jgi:hypothetical protein
LFCTFVKGARQGTAAALLRRGDEAQRKYRGGGAADLDCGLGFCERLDGFEFEDWVSLTTKIFETCHVVTDKSVSL